MCARRLFVVGIGPGGGTSMTVEALEAIACCDVVCGYAPYLELVADIVQGKRLISSGMMREVERCRQALEAASTGYDVALISSGDAGVFGMAAPVLELAAEYPNVTIEVIAGVSAAQSGAAVLGAPLAHDFAVISLSDLLTPWDLIERRLRAAALGDFAVVLYNPSSKRRCDYLARACDILLDADKSPDTACAWVRNIGREGQEKRIISLRELRDETVDMFTTVFIGSSATVELDGRLVTPRGYRQL